MKLDRPCTAERGTERNEVTLPNCDIRCAIVEHGTSRRRSPSGSSKHDKETTGLVGVDEMRHVKGQRGVCASVVINGVASGGRGSLRARLNSRRGGIVGCIADGLWARYSTREERFVLVVSGVPVAVLATPYEMRLVLSGNRWLPVEQTFTANGLLSVFLGSIKRRLSAGSERHPSPACVDECAQ